MRNKYSMRTTKNVTFFFKLSSSTEKCFYHFVQRSSCNQVMDIYLLQSKATGLWLIITISSIIMWLMLLSWTLLCILHHNINGPCFIHGYTPLQFEFQNLMEGTGIYLYIHNFDFSSNFDAFFSLNWYCPSRNKYDDHVLLNLQGHIVFMYSNCKGVYPCIKHGPFILWWSMHKRVHESSINHMIIFDCNKYMSITWLQLDRWTKW
jgi:hypothetical protein